ncbi:MAG: 4-hydroxy-tetrahydrodipicolinate reductase [Oscillospiraceae bacterium]
MKDILLNGCQGYMGHVVAACVAEREDCRIVGGVDVHVEPALSFPVFSSPEDFSEKADVLIDYSHPNSLEGLLTYGIKHKVPIVLATTGYSPKQIENIEEAAKQIPIFFSFNMSLGINLLAELAKKAATFLGSQFDIEIIEKHHNRKIDAPSGTAILLADAINQAMNNQEVYVYDRHSVRKKREKNEIGIHSVRGGTIVGEHEIIFAGHDEVITLSHSAMSREIFAVGSINAALFLSSREQPGLYRMSDLL